MTATMRVLLVHANPFQRALPVPAYGLERLRTAVDDLPVDVRIIDPYLTSSEPVEFAAGVAAEFAPDVIGFGIRVVDDCVIVDRLSDPEQRPHDLTWFLPEIKRLCKSVVASAPGATPVVGGAAFSYFPGECLAYLGLEWGIAGPGEGAFRELLHRLGAGLTPDDMPGIVRPNERPGRVTTEVVGGVTRREHLYAPVNSFPVRTRVGCAMKCSYCLTANLASQNGKRDLTEVLDEIEATVDWGHAHGMTTVPIIFADDEFNLPGEQHAIDVLAGIVERGLHRHITWRAYLNPVPLSEEFAALIAATNGQASITVDSAADEVLKSTRKAFRRRHLDTMLERLESFRVAADLGFIFGLPGETDRTIAETVKFIRDLPPTMSVTYATGARVYPHTPLARVAAAQPERLVGAEDPTFLAPRIYCSPRTPRELAVELDQAFSDRPEVRQAAGAYRSSSPVVSMAHAAASRHTEHAAQEIVAVASRGVAGRTGEMLLASCLQVALWHNHDELAAALSQHLAAPHVPTARSRRPRDTRRRLTALATAIASPARHW